MKTPGPILNVYPNTLGIDQLDMDSPPEGGKFPTRSFALFFVLLVSEFNWNSITWPESHIFDSNVSFFLSFLQDQKQSFSVPRGIHLE
jgi:hypothetical protein